MVVQAYQLSAINSQYDGTDGWSDVPKPRCHFRQGAVSKP